MMKFVCLALLPVALASMANAANPASPLDCKTAYDSVNGDVSATKQDKCKALVSFSKCLSEFPTSKLMDNELFIKNEKACESEWKAISSPEMRTRRGDLTMTVDDAKSVKFYRHRREEISVFDMNSDVAELKTALASMKTALAATEAMVTKTKNDVEANVKADIKKLQDDTAKGIDGLKTKVATDISAVKTNVAGSLKSAASATDTKLRSATSATDTKLAAMKKTVDAAASKSDIAAVTKLIANPAVHMWSGGPKAHNRGAGWADYDMSRVDYDTSKPYFQKISNSRFRALESGLFSYEVDSMAHTSSRGWKHFQFNVNGKWVNGNTHFYTHSWAQLTYRVTWFIKKGETFYGRAHAQHSDPYKWHASSTWNNQHTRIQVKYEGQWPATNIVKCTSSHGLC